MKIHQATCFLMIQCIAWVQIPTDLRGADLIDNEEDRAVLVERLQSKQLEDARTLIRPALSANELAEYRIAMDKKIASDPPDADEGEGGFFVHRISFRLVWEGMRKERVVELWGEPEVIVLPRFDRGFELEIPEEWYWNGDYPASLCFDEQGRVRLHPTDGLTYVVHRRMLAADRFEPVRKSLKAYLARLGFANKQ